MTRLMPSLFAHTVDAVLIGSFLFACGLFVH
jgi:hypothetical protein